jgi:hypothetical protein
MTVDRPKRVSFEISEDLQKMIERLSLETGPSRNDVVRRAIRIMTHLGETPRGNSNKILSEEFERIVISEERNLVGKRLTYLDIDAAQSSAVRKNIQHVLSDKVVPRSVFISYAREDLLVAKKIFKRLSKRGHKPWLDEFSLKKGADWEYEVRKAIKDSEFFVLLLSKTAVAKTGFVQIEVHEATKQQLRRPEGTIFFIPVRLEECEVPSMVAKYNYLDLFRGQGPYRKLLDAIEAT